MLNRKALILAVGLWSMAATAQVPVVEAGGARAQPAAAQSQGNELLLTLYSQLEALQREVQTLRGMVEEQANQVRRMESGQRDRYLDIDRRLSELSGATSSLTPTLPGTTAQGGLPAATPPAAFPGAQSPAPGGVAQGTTTAPSIAFGNAPPVDGTATNPAAGDASLSAEAQLGEQDLYRTALNLLLEQNQYDESVRLFQSYIERFPQGRLLTNAYYWQGEALILVSRFDEARNVFTYLITNFPEDPKAAGAMLKLGVVYQQMGDRARAEETWRNIATRYPENVTEIRAAQDYLNRR